MSAAEREVGEAIIAAAAALIGERGYKATTTRAIAERAGVNEVTIFRRFGSKQGVLLALGESWAAESAGYVVSSIPERADTRATLEALARIEVAHAQRFGVTAMRLALDAPSNPEVAAVMSGGPAQNLAGLTAYLAERQKAGDLRGDIDPSAMTEAFFALTSQIVMSRQVLGPVASYELPVDDVAGQLFELFMRGVSNGEGS